MRRERWGSVAWAVWGAFVLASAGGAARGGWADRVFNEHGHDFGPVPRGAKVRHAFVLTNPLNQPISIVDVRASCGCTTGRATAPRVAPGESATIEAEMDTRNFVGPKATTLTVLLATADAQEAEVRLAVSATILSDIVLNPGTLDFGVVARGRTPVLALTIDRVGLPSWQVRRMVSTCRAVDAVLNETNRDDQTVSYLLKVALRADAPVGTVRDEIRLVTNDPETPVFPILITATIRGALTASPSVLSLGAVSTEGASQGRFLVRASTPFVVRSIEGDGDGFVAVVDDATPRPVHFVAVTYQAAAARPRVGDLRHAFRLQTDLAGEPPLDLSATVHVAP